LGVETGVGGGGGVSGEAWEKKGEKEVIAAFASKTIYGKKGSRFLPGRKREKKKSAFI